MVFLEIRKCTVTNEFVENVPYDQGKYLLKLIVYGNIPVKSNSPRMVSARVISSGLFVVPAF